jgi:hypothetical protein
MISTIELQHHHHQQQQQQQQPPSLQHHRESTKTPDSSGSEEGFVSGGSLPEESFDRLAMQISSFGISSNPQNKNNVYASYLEKPIEEFANSLLSSDRLSSEEALMAAIPQSHFSSSSTRYNNIGGGPLCNTTNLGPHYQQHQQQQNGQFQQQQQSLSSQILSQQQQQQLPGAWFYEMGPLDEPGSGSASTGIPDDCSPMMEMLMDERLAHRHTTESVEVPSSEHVAEIVGRQGCKIKALRAKTSTYIRSPPRGEDPVFLITGRPEDVMEAKREIELAAEHFTQIRASRRHSQGGCAPGHVTAYVRVPLRVVGLVVGPKGATIKRIQQESHTYIVTPSREREPIFEVTGLPHNVESARREIEQHIYQRTGNMPMTDPSASIQNYEMAALAVSNVSRVGSGSGYGTLAQQSQQPAMRQISGYGNEYCGIENIYRGNSNSGLRSAAPGSGIKAYSASGSPPPFYGGNDMMSAQQPNGMGLRQMVNNENIYNPQNWNPQQNCASRMMFNESSLFNDFLPNPRANSFGSTNNYLNNINNNNNGSTIGTSTINYLSSLSSSSHSRDEGLGDSPSSTYNKFNADAFHMLSSIWGDVDTTTNSATTTSSTTTTNGSTKAVDTGLAPQIATA